MNQTQDPLSRVDNVSPSPPRERTSSVPSHRQATAALALLVVLTMQGCTDTLSTVAEWLGYAPQELTDPDAIHNAVHHPDPERRRTALEELNRRQKRIESALRKAASADEDEGVRSTAQTLLENQKRRSNR